MDTQGEKVIIKAHLTDFSSPENVSVKIHFIYYGESSWEEEPMNHSRLGIWEVGLEKKGASGKIYYWLEILDSGGNTSNQYLRYGNITDPKSLEYSTENPYSMAICVVGFFILFILFEVMMRYGILAKRKSKKEEDKDNSDKEESPEKQGDVSL